MGTPSSECLFPSGSQLCGAALTEGGRYRRVRCYVFLNTPLLLGVGRKDDNINWRQSLYFFNALRTLGKPAEMVLYPTAGHGFDFTEWRRRVDRFLDQSLKPRQ